MIYVEDELDALTSDRWAFEEHMHILEEEEAFRQENTPDWGDISSLDIEEYENCWVEEQ